MVQFLIAAAALELEKAREEKISRTQEKEWCTKIPQPPNPRRNRVLKQGIHSSASQQWS